MKHEYMMHKKYVCCRQHRPAPSRSADSLVAQKYMTGRCEAGPTAREAGGGRIDYRGILGVCL